MAASPPDPSTNSLQENNRNSERRFGDNSHVIIPEDGYEWKKYGQKFIRKPTRIRCYFKCKNKRCKAKKRVEWPPTDPHSLRAVYDGAHDHPSPHEPRSVSQRLASSSTANQYDLATQVFGSTS